MASVTLTRIVGSHYRHAAKAILEVLPIGHPLKLVAEPENPYDSNAIKVCLDTQTLSRLPGDVLDELELRANGFGSSKQEICSEPEFHLGFIPKDETYKFHPLLDRLNCEFITLTDEKHPYGLKVIIGKAARALDFDNNNDGLNGSHFDYDGPVQ